MNRIVKTGLRVLLGAALFVAACVAVAGMLYLTADIEPPAAVRPLDTLRVKTAPSGTVHCAGSRLRHSRNGFWEMYVEGDADLRGAAFGAMADSLIAHQERIFVGQIRRLVPDKDYLRFLNVLTQLFNRRITHHIPEEYCREIARMSEYCSHEYDFIGKPYLRQLNYHAAHDIGHAMQDYMLVGCTGLAAWGASSEEGMVVGRNFDFWVGDDFAANRLLTFCRPDRGYGFVSVGWPGMVGVLSGMNDQGLVVTLHASKGGLPLQSATPVSIVAREILQYAATIDEAVAVAARRKVFVSECFMIGSARDGRCVVIEKTPGRQDVFTPAGDRLALSNHFRSGSLKDLPKNRKNIAESDSPLRLARMEELAAERLPLNVRKLVGMLRDRAAVGGRDLGLSNPAAINQQIAHHSVIFLPGELRMWISTGLWGYGEWVCYDVGAILRGERDFDGELAEEGRTIGADSVFYRECYPGLLQYRSLKHRLRPGNADSLRILNPHNWEAHMLCGDCFGAHGNRGAALEAYREALRLVVTGAGRAAVLEKTENTRHD